MIHRLIAQGEHQQQDFKYEISDARKIARTLSAFANTDGGRLLIGVKDNGKIAGVRSDEEIYMVEAAATLYCVPPVQCHMTTHRIEGRGVVIAEVRPVDKRPVRAQLDDGKLCAFMRIADENIVASPVQMALWREANDEEGTLLPFTPREKALLQILSEAKEPMTLNRFARPTTSTPGRTFVSPVYPIRIGRTTVYWTHVCLCPCCREQQEQFLEKAYKVLLSFFNISRAN